MRQQPPPRGAKQAGTWKRPSERGQAGQEIVTKEEAERLSPLEVMDMVKKFRKGNSMLPEVLLQQLEENKKGNLLAKLFGEHTETPDMKVPEITDEQVKEADKVLLAIWEKCPICKKVLDELRIVNPPKTYRWRLREDCGRSGHGNHPHHLLVSGPGGWLLGLDDDHRRGLSHTKHFSVPFLVLHRVRAGTPLSLSWETGQGKGRSRSKHSPVPFLVLH